MTRRKRNSTIVIKEKECSNCGQKKIIWKNHKGQKICEYCWSIIKPKKSSRRWTSEDLEDLKGRVETIQHKEKKSIKGKEAEFAKIIVTITKSGKSMTVWTEATLDRVFQDWVRLNAADENGKCKCVTCSKVVDWRGTGKMHSGHWIPRHKFSTRWNERNVHPQCSNCNTNETDKGRVYEHGKYIESRYGIEVAEELKRISLQKNGPTVVERIEKIIYYRSEIKRIAKEKGLKLN